MTKRKLSLYVLILSILIWAGPFFVGKYIETKYQILTNRFSEFRGTQISPVSYERHWRYSIVKTKVQFSDLAWQQIISLGQNPWLPSFINLPEVEFTLEHRIDHGPIIKTSKDWLGWELARSIVHSKLIDFPMLEAKLANQKLSDVVSLTSKMNLLNGELRIDIQGKPLELKVDEQGKTPIWRGIKGHWTLDSGFTKLVGDLSIPKAQMTLHAYELDIHQLRFKTQRSRNQTKLWQGVGLLSIQNFKLNSADNLYPVAGHQLEWLGELKVEQGLASSSMGLAFKKLNYQDKDYGPLDLSVSILHIPEDLFLLGNELFQNMPKQQPWAHFVFNDTLLASLPRLLAQRPVFQVEKLELKTPEGPLKGQLYLAIGGKEIHRTLNTHELINTAEINLELKVPKMILENALRFYFEKNYANQDLGTTEAVSDLTYQTIQSWMNQGLLDENIEEQSYELLWQS